MSIFLALDSGRFAKEALPEIMRQYLTNPGISIEDAISRSGLSSISAEELEKIVTDTIAQNADLLKVKGPAGAERTLMGKVMQQVRGKADGKLVSETLSKQLWEFEKGKS